MFVGGAVGCASIGDYESILSMGPSYECPLAKKSINWQNYVRHTLTDRAKPKIHIIHVR